MYQPAFQPQFHPAGHSAGALGVAAALGMGAAGRNRAGARTGGRMAFWVSTPARAVPLAHEVPTLRAAHLADRAVPSADALDAMSLDERARLLGEW